MNDPFLTSAAKLLIQSEPKIGEFFTLEQVAEHIRILSKRLVVAAEMKRREGADVST